MALLDPNKKFLYFNPDTTSGEVDSALCFPVSSLIGINSGGGGTAFSGRLYFYFEGSKGTDATIVQVNKELKTLKEHHQAIINEINFGEKAFIKVYDRAELSTSPTDIFFALGTVAGSNPDITLQDTDFKVSGTNLTFDSVQLTGIQTSAESFVNDDVSLMTSAAIEDKILSYGYSTTSGDITAVTITTDSGGGSVASDASGSADFSILGATGVGVTNSGTTITAVAVPGEIDHDSLQNFVANEHLRWDNDVSSTATIHANNITDLHGAGVDGSANQLLTDDGDGTVTSESELTYNASVLQIESSTSERPSVRLVNSNTDANGPDISFQKTATGADNDLIGNINFVADNDADEVITYASIKSAIKDASDTDEAGQYIVQVATSDGSTSTLRSALFAAGSPSADDVDVTLGHGSTSVVTVPGRVSTNRIDIDSVGITGIQTAGESFADNDTSLMTSAAIDDRINAAGGGVSVADSNTDTAFPVVFHDESNNLLDDTGGFTYNPNSGNLAVPGNITAKTFQSLPCSFFDDIGTTKHYIPISTQSTSEQTSDGNTFTDFLVPCTIRVHEVMLKLPGTTTGSGDITIGIETSNIGSSVFTKSVIETETVTVADSNDNDIVHFMFDTAVHATRGQNLSISIQNSADLSGSQNWYVNAIVEFDWSTKYSGSSALQTS